jgi:hypothetical protein
VNGAAVRPVSFGLLLLTLVVIQLGNLSGATADEPGVRGVVVVPHKISEALRYRRERTPDLAARVELYVSGPASVGTFDGRSPSELLEAKEWAWHDLDDAVAIPAGAIGVWTFNGATDRWGAGRRFTSAADSFTAEITIEAPKVRITTIGFPADQGAVFPERIVAHVANETDQPLDITALRLWLPRPGEAPSVLWPSESIPVATTVPPQDQGFVDLTHPPLPLTESAIEIVTDQGSLWAHRKIRAESFDISGGWIGEDLHDDAYLDLLANLHVNTGQFQEVAGYTDDPDRFARHPIKAFNRMTPLERFDTDTWLPRIHAVEFLGEPQYGGGRPVPPQDVYRALAEYRSSRLSTTVTHSEERIWRFYAGLSDYPHFDAYRVVAPAADAWREYDRWEGKRIRWGAPLETIGDLTRSLRDLNRPVPIAAWTQGPHHGWGGGFDGRRRRSPNADELRSQALHAISSRITSLYWFNLSRRSLLKYPDTWEAIRRIGREVRAAAPILLAGDSYEFRRLRTADDRPDWDLTSITAPSAALLFALDTAYTIDPEVNEFRFGPPRSATFSFRLPSHLREPTDVKRVDAEGVHAAHWHIEGDRVVIEGEFAGDAIFLVANDPEAYQDWLRRLDEATAQETAHPIDRATLEGDTASTDD